MKILFEIDTREDDEDAFGMMLRAKENQEVVDSIKRYIRSRCAHSDLNDDEQEVLDDVLEIIREVKRKNVE